MGFWDKVKGAVQSVTGSAAKVDIAIGDATIGETCSVRIEATSRSDLDVAEVYVEIRSVEQAEVRDVDYHHGNGSQRIEYIQAENQTFKQRFKISGPGSLSEGETRTWEGGFIIPDSVNPTFEGEMISHHWEVLAGLDVYGNDPDSGWLRFDVWEA